MTVAIRQEINILNREIAGTTVSYEKIDMISGDYNGETFYFEVIAKNSDVTGLQVELWDSLTNTVATVTIPPLTSTYGLYRSSSFDLSGHSPRYTIKRVSNAISVKAARIVILQSAVGIMDTQTQIEVGQYAIIEPPDNGIWYPIPEPKYWKYESAKWEPTPTFTFGFTMGIEDDKETYIVGLQEASDAAFTTNVSEIADSQVTVNTEPIAYYESSSFTLTNGYYYRVVYQSDDDKGDLITLYNAKIIATQQNSGVNQNSTVTEIWINGASGTFEERGQSFNTGASGFEAVGIALWCRKIGYPTDNLIVELRSTSIEGTVLATATVDGSTIPDSYSWFFFQFSSAYTLSSTTKYYFTIRRSGSRDLENKWNFNNSGDRLASAGLYVKDSGSWGSEQSNDMSFKIVENFITKLQPEYLLTNDGEDSTGDAEFMTDFDADEWVGVSNIYYHEHSASGASSNSKLVDSGGDITDSSITGANLQRSSALTLTDDEEIDANVVAVG